MSFVRFMASRTGRLVRFFGGALLIAIGFVAGGGWIAVAIVGLVPLLAAAFDVCAFAPLFHQPCRGRYVRG